MHITIRLIHSWRDMYLWNVWIETSTCDDNDLVQNLAYSRAMTLFSWNKKKSVTLKPVTHNGTKTSRTLRAWLPCHAAISNFSRFFSFKLTFFCGLPAPPKNTVARVLQAGPAQKYCYPSSANQQTAQFNELFVVVSCKSLAWWMFSWRSDTTDQKQFLWIKFNSGEEHNFEGSDPELRFASLLIYADSMGHISSFKTSASLAPLIQEVLVLSR